MSKSRIIELLQQQAIAQAELNLLPIGLKFDAQSVARIAQRQKLLRQLSSVKKELSLYTPEQIEIALSFKQKVIERIRENTQEEPQEELVLIDNSFIRFLMYLLILQSAKPENKFFFAIAINTFFGDTYEKKLKR